MAPRNCYVKILHNICVNFTQFVYNVHNIYVIFTFTNYRVLFLHNHFSVFMLLF